MKNLFLLSFMSACVFTGFAQKAHFQKINTVNGISKQYVKFEVAEQIPFKSADARKTFGLEAGSDLRLMNTEADKLGQVHYRFYQTYDNIPVENSMFIVHTAGGKLLAAGGTVITQFSPGSVQNKTAVTPATALNRALNYVNAKKYAWQDTAYERNLKITNGRNATYYPVPEKVWYSKNISDPATLKLVYKIDVYTLIPFDRRFIYVNAGSGEITGDESQIMNSDVSGIASTGYSGEQYIRSDFTGSNYRLRDLTKGNGIITLNAASNNSDFIGNSPNWVLAGADQWALDAHFGVSSAWTFYKNNFYRNSVDNAGYALTSLVNVAIIKDNSGWTGSELIFGNAPDGRGNVTIDVVGHEFTHGVSRYTCKLVPNRESGAISESLSDILGKAIQFYTKPQDIDWRMGNDMGANSRNLANPNANRKPDTYRGKYWISTAPNPTFENDRDGVHTNCTVGDFMFYLLVSGGSGTNDIGNPYHVSGIGLEKAQQIIYRSQTVYLTSFSQYADWRIACINAATDLYGAGSNEVIQVNDAWYAVGLDGYCLSNGAGPNTGSITNVTFNTINNTTALGGGYADHMDHPTTVRKGNTYILSVKVNTGGGHTDYIKAWIDWNRDGEFSTTEEYNLGTATNTSDGVTSLSPLSVTVPPDAVVGIVRMRISSKTGYTPSPCETSFSGETEDYAIIVEPSCAIPGLLQASLKPSGTEAVLSWTPVFDAINYTLYYRAVTAGNWEIDYTSPNPHVLRGLTPNTEYRFGVVSNCGALPNISLPSNIASFTTPVSSPPPPCPSAGHGGYSDCITNVTFNTINNNSGPAGYSNFTALSTTVVRGNSYNLSVRINTDGNYINYTKAWIDWNRDGTFSSAEEYDLSTAENVIYGPTLASPLSVTVPANAAIGNVRMRVITKYNEAPSACETSFDGETEDYIITVTEKCDIPAELSTSVTGTTAVLNWAAIPGAAGYFIQYRETGAQAWETGTALSNTHGLSGFVPGKTYEFKVATLCNATIIGPYSNVTLFTTASPPPYCISAGVPLCELTSVIFNTINNHTSATQTGYNDYTSLSTTVTHGSTYNLYAGVNTGLSANNVKAWIDWNDDGIFNTIDEEYDLGSVTTYGPDVSTSLSPLPVTVPANAITSTVRMRVTSKRNGSPLPCEPYFEGETEDYSINIISACNPPEGLEAFAVTGTTADLNWIPVPGASYNIEYRVRGALTWAVVAVLGPYTLKDLIPGTEYECRIASICYPSGNTYLYSDIVLFTTANPSPYCISTGTNISGITNVTFNTINNNTDPDGYADYSALSTTVTRGSTYTLSARINTSGPWKNYTKAWIDWNDDGIFSALTEGYDLGSATGVSDGVTSLSPLSVTVPANAIPSTIRMRVTTKFNLTPLPCEASFDGETEDYSVIVSTGCLAPVGLTASIVTGTAATFTWTPIPGAAYNVQYKNSSNTVWTTATTLSDFYKLTNLDQNTAYEFRVATICDATNISTYNAISFHTASLPPVCASAGLHMDGITNVTFNTINNTSHWENSYTDYTAQTTTVSQGGTYALHARINTGGDYTNYTKAWIDWNHDGIFTTAEEYDLGGVTNVMDGITSTVSVTVPANAVIGTCRMRVSTRYLIPPNACEASFDGEVEDYSLEVTAGSNRSTYTEAPVTKADEVIKATGTKVKLNPGEKEMKVFPNPTAGERLTIQYSIPAEGNVTVVLTDIFGRQIHREWIGRQTKGTYSFTMKRFDKLATGNYFVVLYLNNEIKERAKVIISK